MDVSVATAASDSVQVGPVVQLTLALVLLGSVVTVMLCVPGDTYFGERRAFAAAARTAALEAVRFGILTVTVSGAVGPDAAFVVVPLPADVLAGKVEEGCPPPPPHAARRAEATIAQTAVRLERIIARSPRAACFGAT